jgi:hypothetical protein
MAPVLRKLGIAALFVVSAAPALAQSFALDADLGLAADQRLCRYAGAITYLAPPEVPCPPDIAPGPDLGYLVRTYVEGIARYCIYRTSDAARPIRVASNEPCPFAFQFTAVR